MNITAKLSHPEMDIYGILTTEHSSSSYGQPVFVEQITGISYGPGDIIAHPVYAEIKAPISDLFAGNKVCSCT